MIESSQESLLSFAEVTRVVPPRRGGKRLHIATVYRWARHGCRGVRLETIQIGGSSFTSREALERFYQALTRQGEGRRSATPSHPTWTAEDDRRAQRLDEEGL